jgi:hypothetical protein
MDQIERLLLVASGDELTSSLVTSTEAHAHVSADMLLHGGSDCNMALLLSIGSLSNSFGTSNLSGVLTSPVVVSI